jgi:parvulin-like peptidyl-prolyl isomerase
VAEPTPKGDGNKTPGKPAVPAPKSTAPARSSARSTPFWQRVPALTNQPATFIIAFAVVVVAVVALVAFGYWNSYVGPGRAAAVRVGDKTYNMSYFARRMKATINDPVSSGVSASQILSLPEQLATDIIEEEVLLQRASTLGVGASDAEIDGLMAEKLAVVFSKDDSGNIQSTPAFANSIRNALQRSGLSLAEYRRSVHAQQLRIAVRKHFENQIPKETPAVLLRQIAVADEAKAKELKTQIEGGADFAALVAALSEDSLTKDKGGLRDWAPKGFLPEEFEKEAYTLPIGGVSTPFQSSGKWVLYRVEERQDARELTEQERTQLASKQMSDWLDEQRKSLTTRSYLDDQDRQEYALDHSGALEFIRNSNPAGRPTLPIPGGGGTP